MHIHALAHNIMLVCIYAPANVFVRFVVCSQLKDASRNKEWALEIRVEEVLGVESKVYTK